MLLFYKHEGETPLECLNRFRLKNSEYKDQKISYVGRLDPMAEGYIMFIIGEENKDREKYLNKDKIYEIEVLLGFKTDTGDILGLVDDYEKNKKLDFSDCEISQKIKTLEGEQIQQYPWFSSKTMMGKPLFFWKKNQVENKGTKSKKTEIFFERPSKNIKIYKIDFLYKNEISLVDLKTGIPQRISKVKGDFRQNQILEKWNIVFAETERKNKNITSKTFPILGLRIYCSSGTYMRVLAEKIGNLLGFEATLAYRIKRTEIL